MLEAFVERVPTPAPRTPLTARERNAARRGEGRQAGAAAGATGDAAEDREAATGTVRVQATAPVQSTGVPEGRVEAIEALDLPQPEENPFAPLGIRVGTFILRPSIEQGVTATSNADYSVDGSEAVLSETTLRLNAVSDWSRNSAVIDAFGTFRKSLSGEEVSDFRGAAVGTFELDMTDEWTARAVLGYETAPETASSPVTILGFWTSRSARPSAAVSGSKRMPARRASRSPAASRTTPMAMPNSWMAPSFRRKIAIRRWRR